VRVPEELLWAAMRGPAFCITRRLIDAAATKREGIVTTTFDVALVKFNRSQSDDSPYEHLVDLPTALGGALIGAERAPIHAPLGTKLRS
jgi:hypothetical protein